MILLRTFATSSILLLLAGCTTTRYCEGPQDYETARSIPEITAPEGLAIPRSSTALRVPEVKNESLTFGYVAPDPDRPGKTRIYCLDQPPGIPSRTPASAPAQTPAQTPDKAS